MASRLGFNVNQRFSSLELNGGRPYRLNSALTPDLIVHGSSKFNSPAFFSDDVNVTGNLNVYGNVISDNMSLVLLDSFTGNAAVWIPTATGLGDIQIDEPPCKGYILSIDEMSGNILYALAPNLPTTMPIMDAYQYHGVDQKGLQTNVTQLVCFQKVPPFAAPFFEEICLNRAPLGNFTDAYSTIGSYNQSYGSLTGFITVGTFPIDWSTLTITSIQAYTQNKDGVKDCEQWALVPPVLGTNTSSALTGPGVVLADNSIQFTSVLGATFTFTVNHDNLGGISVQFDIADMNDSFASDLFISVDVRVADVNGTLSNIATMFIEESSNFIVLDRTTGSFGTVVTITGTMDFTDTLSFKVNGFDGIVVSSTPTSMIGFVMPGSTDGPITVETVANGEVTSEDSFIITATPTPVTQNGAKLVGTGGTYINQGWSHALSANGDHFITCDPYDDSDVGALWYFRQISGVWTQQGDKFTVSGAIGYPEIGGTDDSGMALSADGAVLAVTGGTDNTNVGALWIFTRSGIVWTQQAKLVPTGGSPQFFGFVVDISADGKTVVVGSDRDDLFGVDYGAAYVFVENNGVWTQDTILFPNNNIGSPRFGVALSISSEGNTLAVSGPSDNGDIGAVWIFVRSGGIWTQQAKLIPNDYTGLPLIWYCSISADGNILAVSSYATSSRLVWVFDRVGTMWTQRGTKYTITSSVGTSGRLVIHPSGLSADGETLTVALPEDSSNAGAQWVLSRNGSSWTEVAKLTQVGTNRFGLGHGSISSNGFSLAVGNRNNNGNWMYTA